MLSNMKETDENLPYRHGAYFYYTRTVKGLAYKIHCRKKATTAEQSVLEAQSATPPLPEEIILDENAVATGLGWSYAAMHYVILYVCILTSLPFPFLPFSPPRLLCYC
jgi:protease II